MTFATHSTFTPQSWGKGRSERDLAEEVAVAIVANGSTLAVMMATPADLEAFGIGFALAVFAWNLVAPALQRRDLITRLSDPEAMEDDEA